MVSNFTLDTVSKLTLGQVNYIILLSSGKSALFSFFSFKKATQKIWGVSDSKVNYPKRYFKNEFQHHCLLISFLRC